MSLLSYYMTLGGATGRMANFTAGNNDYLRLTGGLSQLSGQNSTVEFWYRRITSDGGNGEMFLGTNTGGSWFWQFTPATSNVYIAGQQITASVNNAGWNHYALIAKPSEVRILRNGVLLAQKTTTSPNIPNTSKNWEIGRWIGGTGWGLNGELDALRVWNHARTDEDILNNYQLRIGQAEGLVLSLSNEGQDLSGIGNHFTPFNVPYSESTAPIR
jgi:hypothetical protein